MTAPQVPDGMSAGVGFMIHLLQRFGRAHVAAAHADHESVTRHAIDCGAGLLLLAVNEFLSGKLADTLCPADRSLVNCYKAMLETEFQALLDELGESDAC